MVGEYQRDVQLAREKLDLLLKWREGLETLIARTRRKITLLAELSEESESTEIPDLGMGGLEDACITVLRGSKKDWLTTAEIQFGLKELGFPLDQYNVPHASITAAVNSLADADKITVDRQSTPGETQYNWTAPNATWIDNFGKMLADDMAKGKADDFGKTLADSMVQEHVTLGHRAP